jgi:glycosyltransferase involved in cell wall biosynthesis
VNKIIFPTIVVLTDIPSPYQVETFNALNPVIEGELAVIYVRQTDSMRQWSMPELHHQYCFLNQKELKKAKNWISYAELVIFCGYRTILLQNLIALRQRVHRAWAFWGERPGFIAKGKLGKLVRIVSQHRIRRAGIPIWGIGAWAVDAYTKEMGRNHLYLNVPYFSNLRCFLKINRSCPLSNEPVRFLFSGSLTKRKGSDLLVRAFVALLREGVQAKLTFLGSGPLEQPLRKAAALAGGSIEFLGFRQWQELPDIYARSDVLCAPSRYDGWGLVVAEGLAGGMPVIATDRMGAARELITKENGWLVRAGSMEDLIDAMRQAAHQPLQARQAAIEAARIVALKQNLDHGTTQIKNAVTLSIAECARLGMS